jgi:peptidoglycan biosynthesis protein MviN/MurJ (putative lipid II flippase)
MKATQCFVALIFPILFRICLEVAQFHSILFPVYNEESFNKNDISIALLAYMQ